MPRRTVSRCSTRRRPRPRGAAARPSRRPSPGRPTGASGASGDRRRASATWRGRPSRNSAQFSMRDQIGIGHGERVADERVAGAELLGEMVEGRLDQRPRRRLGGLGGVGVEHVVEDALVQLGRRGSSACRSAGSARSVPQAGARPALGLARRPGTAAPTGPRSGSGRRPAEAPAHSRWPRSR